MRAHGRPVRLRPFRDENQPIGAIRALAVASMLAALGACVPGPLEPPQLEMLTLDYGGPPVDPLARDPKAPVVVRNGKGEVLTETVPDATGNVTANPSLSQFDGTFVIEVKRNDGSIDRQRLTYPAGQPVMLRRDAATGRYVAEAPPPQFLGPRVSAELGFLNLDRADTKLFRRENGGVIRGAAIEQQNRADGFSGKIGIDFPIGLGGLLSPKTRASVGLRAGFLDSTASAAIGDVLANGDQFGIFTPGNGVVTGQNLRDTAYSSDYRERFIGVDLDKAYEVYGDLRLKSSIGVTYGYQTVEEVLSTRTAITSTQIDHRQDTDSRYLGIPMSVAVWKNPFPNYMDFWLTAGGTLEPRYHRGETDWRVAVTGLADRTQTLKENEWTVGGGIHLGAYFGDPLNLRSRGYPISAGVKIGLQWSATPQVEYNNLNAGDGGAALEHKTGQAAYGTFSATFRF